MTERDDRITPEQLIFWCLVGLLMWLGIFRFFWWVLK